jgi:hypothetical protein
MSPLPISRSHDVALLAHEGYVIEIRQGHLLVHDVPYVNANREVRLGTLVSSLMLAGDVTQTPDTHVAFFIGEHPCHADGRTLTEIQHAGQQVLGDGLVADWGFSSKPSTGYPDYHNKMTTYINMISAPARQIDPKATARTYRKVVPADEGSVFHYLDTSTARAKIGHIAARAAVDKVAIIGLGGTGAYVLDLLSKTETNEIHLYDADRYWQHNAFRAPGATSGPDLEGAPYKVDFYAQRYGAMRAGIVAHPQHADATTLDDLREMACVFICIDDGPSRGLLVNGLQDSEATIIDVGMGLVVENDQMAGLVRVTTTVPGRRDHADGRIPTHQDSDNDVYGQNIQIAELNALNAALAVIKWKKIRNVYVDAEHELNSVYVADGNLIINDEQSA